jgi:hypothetical protein
MEAVFMVHALEQDALNRRLPAPARMSVCAFFLF